MFDVIYDNQNIFVKILCGELLCIKVYEDDYIIVFMDIMLQVDGYVLVLFKEGVVELFDLLDDVVLVVICIMCKLVCVVCVVFMLLGIVVFQFNGSVVGQMVLYVYFYVLLCYSDMLL